jgi:hypothetical protein
LFVEKSIKSTIFVRRKVDEIDKKFVEKSIKSTSFSAEKLRFVFNPGPDHDYCHCFQVSEARVLIFDPALFKLNLLLTMTQQNSESAAGSSGRPAGSPTPFSSLHYKYATVLHRRLWWMFTSGRWTFPDHLGGPDDVQGRIQSSIRSLERISSFLRIVLDTAQCQLPHLI